MTATLPRSRVRYLAPTRRERHLDGADDPQPVGIVTAFWRLMGSTSRRTAERELAITRRGIARLADACRQLDRMDYLADVHGYSDAQRRNDGAPMAYTNALACQVAAADNRENQVLVEYLACPTPDNRLRLIAALQRDIQENSELLSSLSAVTP